MENWELPSNVNYRETGRLQLCSLLALDRSLLPPHCHCWAMPCAYSSCMLLASQEHPIEPFIPTMGSLLLTPGETGGFRVQNVLLSLWLPLLSSVFRAGACFMSLGGGWCPSLQISINAPLYKIPAAWLWNSGIKIILASQSIIWVFDLIPNIVVFPNIELC